MTSALDLVKDLIAFDTTSRDSNLALIGYAQALLEKAGARCRRTFDVTGQKANLFATFGPDADGGFVLSGHTDVVPVDGQEWSSDPFRPEVRDGLLIRRSPEFTYYNKIARLTNWQGKLLGGHPPPPAGLVKRQAT